MVRMARYRVGQFLQALTAGVPEAEVEQAMHILPPKARGLFRRQAVQDQRHALAVYHTLRQAGHKNPRLLAAALLHDAGKAAARIPAWQRAVIVLLERFAPRLLAWLSQGEPLGCALSLPKGCVLSLPKGCALSPSKGCVLSLSKGRALSPSKGCVLSLSKGRALSLSKGRVLSLPKGWRRPFVAHARHPQVGARWAGEAGCSPLTVALIRRHQDQSTGCSPLTVEEDRLLAALQAADSLN